MPEYPEKLFFYCEVEPAEGGETPILLSHLIYERMAKEWPEFVEKLQKEGVLYTRVLPEGDDLSSAIGRGWQSTFLTTDRLEAEKRQVCTSSVCLSGLGCCTTICLLEFMHVRKEYLLHNEMTTFGGYSLSRIL